jgi:hypothetical protein
MFCTAASLGQFIVTFSAGMEPKLVEHANTVDSMICDSTE